MSGEYHGQRPWRFERHGGSKQDTYVYPSCRVANDIEWTSYDAKQWTQQKRLPQIRLASTDGRRIVKLLEVFRQTWRGSGSYLDAWETACRATDYQNNSIQQGELPEPNLHLCDTARSSGNDTWLCVLWFVNKMLQSDCPDQRAI